MSCLAPDILREIIDTVGSGLIQLNFNHTTFRLSEADTQTQKEVRETLSNLSLVSHEFCFMARTYLFRTVSVGHQNSALGPQSTSFHVFHDILTRNLGNIIKCVRYLVIDQPPVEWGANNWSPYLSNAYCSIMNLLGPQLRVFGFSSAVYAEYKKNKIFSPKSPQTLTLLNTLKSQCLTRIYIYGNLLPFSVLLSFPQSLKRLELINTTLDIPYSVSDAKKKNLQCVFARLEGLGFCDVGFDRLLNLFPSPNIALGGIRNLYVKMGRIDGNDQKMLKGLTSACSESLECLTLDFNENPMFGLWEGSLIDKTITEYINLKNAKKLRIMNVAYPVKLAQSIGTELQNIPDNSKLEKIYLAVTHEEYIFCGPGPEDRPEEVKFIPDSVVAALVSPSLTLLKNVKLEINICGQLKMKSVQDQKRIWRIIFGNLEKEAAERTFKLELGTDITEDWKKALLVRREYCDINDYLDDW
ncbi:hypothetical protein BDQ17DRAFT_1428830 [Cyathus striatus]|nr:hypothetical protein BDQ17DRAFT_1428830 [Cyathus striatus]